MGSKQGKTANEGNLNDPSNYKQVICYTTSDIRQLKGLLAETSTWKTSEISKLELLKVDKVDNSGLLLQRYKCTLNVTVHPNLKTVDDLELVKHFSSTLCKELLAKNFNLWFDSKVINESQLQKDESRRTLPVNEIAFGTFERVGKFVKLQSQSPSESDKIDFDFDKNTITIYSKCNESWFSLKIQKHFLVPIIHVSICSENTINVYLQLHYAPLIFEKVEETEEGEEIRLGVGYWNRRCEFQGYKMSERDGGIGICDVIRLTFLSHQRTSYWERQNSSKSFQDLEAVFKNLQSRRFSSSGRNKSEPICFRFMHVTECIFKSIDMRKEFRKLQYPFQVLYALEVLYSVGLKCRLEVSSAIVPQFPEFTNLEWILYRLAEEFPKECEYYLLDASKVVVSLSNESNRNYNEALLGKVLITPSRVIISPPEYLDGSQKNRIIRRYGCEYLLTVAFSDEDLVSKLGNSIRCEYTDSNLLVDTIDQRLEGGIMIGNREYRYLGQSNSMLRENACYLCAEWHDGRQWINSEVIRTDVGDLHRIRNVAQYAARLGLAFTDTRKSAKIHPACISLENDISGDLENEKPYCFSDGIGRISPNLVQEIGLDYGKTPQPSAYQIRMGGFKGVLALDPTLNGKKIQLIFRKSMKKFESSSHRLELVSTSAPKYLHMNDQILTLLSQRGDTLINRNLIILACEQLKDLLFSLIENEAALRRLDSCGISHLAKNACRYGRELTTDPFIFDMNYKDLKNKLERTKCKRQIEIPPNDGRNMMGVLDETGTLNYGQVFVQFSVEKNSREKKIHIGTVMVSKMPALHPGDLRKLTAVEVPELHHMVDVIVFPQKGPRPHPNEMSGSDLDGDEYFVLWNPDLIVRQQNYPAMKFPSSPMQLKESEITEEDLIEHLRKTIENDILGIVSSQHLYQADYQPGGIYSDQCIQLAQLSSRAVDANKTGEVVQLDRNLRMDKIPDFSDKADHKVTYESKRLLGIIYRDCSEALKVLDEFSGNMQRSTCTSSKFSNRRQFPEISAQLRKLNEMYCKEIRTLAYKYKIKSEANIWKGQFSTYVIASQRKKLDTDFKNLKRMVNSEVENILSKSDSRQVVGQCFQLLESDEIEYHGLPWLVLANSCLSHNAMNASPRSRDDYRTYLRSLDDTRYTELGRDVALNFVQENVLLAQRMSLHIIRKEKPMARTLEEIAVILVRHPWLILVAEAVSLKLSSWNEKKFVEILQSTICVASELNFVNIAEREEVPFKASLRILCWLAGCSYKIGLLTEACDLAKRSGIDSATDLLKIGKTIIYTFWQVYSIPSIEYNSMSQNDTGSLAAHSDVPYYRVSEALRNRALKALIEMSFTGNCCIWHKPGPTPQSVEVESSTNEKSETLNTQLNTIETVLGERLGTDNIDITLEKFRQLITSKFPGISSGYFQTRVDNPGAQVVTISISGQGTVVDKIADYIKKMNSVKSSDTPESRL